MRARSPLYMPPTCGIVTWISSMNISASRRQVVDQRRRRLAGVAARQVPRIVLDALCRSRSRSSSRGRSACAARCAAPRSASSAPTKNSFCVRELELDRLDRVEHLLPARHVVRRREHREARRSCCRMCPVSGSKSCSDSTSSSNSETRTAFSAFSAGKMSSTSPRTRNVPRLKSSVVALVLHLGQALDRVALRQLVALPSGAGSCCGIRSGRRCRRSPTPSRR